MIARPTPSAPHRARRILETFWGVSVLIGLMILALPDGLREPLIPGSAWRIEGGFFENDAPGSGEVRRAIYAHPDAHFFRSWSPGTGAAKGIITTTPFELPEYIAVPYAGSPMEEGIELALECVGSGNKLPITSGNTQNDWVERVMRIPRGWCEGRARLFAVTTSETNFIATQRRRIVSHVRQTSPIPPLPTFSTRTRCP